jgi:integrase
VAPGERSATTDPDVATRLASVRLQELETARRRRAFHSGRAVEAQLGAFARLHLIAKKKAGKVTDTWLESTELFLERAVSYFGAERELDTIRVSDIRGWIAFLDALKTPAGRRLGPATIRLHLSALSNLYRRAQEEEVVFPGYNPVAALMEKPTPIRREAKWIETHDAAVLLLAAEALPPRGGTSLDTDAIAQIRATWELGKTSKLALARAYGVSNAWITRVIEGQDATPPVHEAQLAYSLVATYLLTGGLESEVTGLELDDVSLDRQTITFRPNAWRRLKTPGSHRVVRLWPQLREILGPYLDWRVLQRGGRLLFPSPWSATELIIGDVRNLLDRVARRAGLDPGEIRTKAFRHTYCAARLQTLDQGAPVSTYTVARELGHESEAMVRKVYAHLGAIRHRSEVVDFRVEQHFARLGDRLQRLGLAKASDTAKDTAATAGPEKKSPHDHESDGGVESWDAWAMRGSNPRPRACEARALTS